MPHCSVRRHHADIIVAGAENKCLRHSIVFWRVDETSDVFTRNMDFVEGGLILILLVDERQIKTGSGRRVYNLWWSAITCHSEVQFDGTCIIVQWRRQEDELLTISFQVVVYFGQQIISVGQNYRGKASDLSFLGKSKIWFGDRVVSWWSQKSLDQ